MMVCDLKEEPSPMLNDSCSDIEEMIPKRFEASRPPGSTQGLRRRNLLQWRKDQ